MTSENFTHNFIYYCFASLTNLCNISLLQYLSVPWPLEGGRRGISRIILHLLHHHYQKARASLAQSGPSGFIKVKVGGGYIWEFSLNVSLCASDAQLRRIKRNKHTDKLDFPDIVSGCLCFRKCSLLVVETAWENVYFSWLTWGHNKLSWEIAHFSWGTCKTWSFSWHT